MFYCGRVAFTVFKHADIKGLRERLTSTASLNDGYCEATILVVKGHHVTMGGARETALASSTYAPFTRRLLTFTGWNWKCHVIIVIKTDLSGFVVPMHSGLCEQYVKSLGYALGIWLPVSPAPSSIWTTNPSRTGLNPLMNICVSNNH